MAVKVFISYAWEDEAFSHKILEFSNKLRKNGIDANIDQYEENPDMGWPIWMENQIETSDYVLVVCTETYYKKYLQLQEGKGVTWEISSIYQSLYNLKGHNDKFIPVVFEESDSQYILKTLQPYTMYNIDIEFNKLLNRLKGIPNTIKPPVIEDIPDKPRKTIFIDSPIDIELWDKAKWYGTVFLTIPEKGCALGFFYDGDTEAATSIFKQWQKDPDFDNHIKIVFVEGDTDGLPKNGYTCLIEPNIQKSLEKEMTDCMDGVFVLAITRFQRMYPKDNFQQYNMFKELSEKNIGIPVPIIPVTLNNPNLGFSNDNAVLHFDCMVFTKNVSFITVDDIQKNDLESCILPQFNVDFPF